MIEPGRDAPDLEDLAAYLDGRLSGDRKARVEERLLRDEDYYDVFMENVRFQEEEAESGGGEVVAPAAWRRSWRLGVPLGVAAALIAAIGLWRFSQGPPTGELVARLDPAAVVARGDGWDSPGWSPMRSLEPAYDHLRPEHLAFRLGVRAVDLRIALAGRDERAAGLSAAQLAALTGADDVLVYLRAPYRQLLERIGDGDFEALAAEAAELEALLRDGLGGSPEARSFALGAWSECGRLAALAGDRDVLESVWRGRRVARSTPEIDAEIDLLRSLLDQPELGSEDFEKAAGAFAAVNEKLAG